MTYPFLSERNPVIPLDIVHGMTSPFLFETKPNVMPLDIVHGMSFPFFYETNLMSCPLTSCME